MTRKLIFIIGNSGSGKDTVADYMCQKYGYHKVPSYTTRPKRKDERDGDTHVFVHWGGVAHRPDVWCTLHGETMLTMTYFAGHYYFASQQQLLAHEKMIYIIDEKGLLDILQDRYKLRWLQENFHYEVWHLLRPDNDTDYSRQLRDQGRIALADEMYDRTLHNIHDLDYLLSAVDAAVLHSEEDAELQQQEGQQEG